MSYLGEQLALALDTIEAKSQKCVCFACAARMLNIASDSDLDTSEHQVVQWELAPMRFVGEDPLSTESFGRNPPKRGGSVIR